MKHLFPEFFSVWGYIDPGTGFTVTSLGGLIIMALSGALGILLFFFKKVFKFFRKFKKSVIIVLCLLAAAAGIFFLRQRTSGIKMEHKIVILGMDALSPQIMEPLMDQGRLPHFTALKQSGAYRRLQTTNPPQSPVAWAGFATGMNPGKTGVFDFISRDPKTYGIQLSLSHMPKGRPEPVIKAPRFWQHTSRRNIPSVIIGCPVTYPPDKVHGKMLSGMGVPDILGTEGTFTFYTTEKEQPEETTGGKVFSIRRSEQMIVNLIGPRLAKVGQAPEHVKVPVKVNMDSSEQISLAYQGQNIHLREGQWSRWRQVTFDLGWFRKAKGIFQFHLVSVEPEFRLYITPINFDPRQPFYPVSYPRGYAQELVDEIGLFHTQGMPFDTWALNEQRISEEVFLYNANEVLAEKEAMLDLELRRLENGVLFMYFESADIIQHMFWRYIDPQHPLYEPDAAEKYKQLIASWYERMDAILGMVMEKLAAEDTLLVLSDHGFDTFRRTVHLNTWLRDNGYLELNDPGAMTGAPMLKDVDWSKTRAYALGFGGIYINERGREEQGIVSPGQEKEQLKDEISAKLEQWIDSKYQLNVVHKVYPRQEVFWGPYQDQTPDLLVGYSRGYRASWQTAVGDAPKNILDDNLRKWSGSHLFDAKLVPGVLFSSRPVNTDDPSILDLAPSVLKLTGFSEQEIQDLEFDGKTLF